MNGMNKPFLRALFLLAIICGIATGEAFSYSFVPSLLESPIVVRNGEVFFLQPDGSLTVLDAEDGTVLRRLKFPYRISFSAFDVIDGDILGVGRLGTYKNEVFRMDGKTGRIHWRFPGYSVLRYRNLAIGSDREGLFALDLATGRKLWGWSSKVEMRYDAIGDELYALHEGREWPPECGFLVCLDIATGRQKWRRDAPAGEKWVKMGLFDDAVRILAGKAEQHADLDRVVCFSRDGTPLPPETPAAGDAGKRAYAVWQKTMRADGKVYRSGVIQGMRSPCYTYMPSREECGRAGLDYSTGFEGMPLEDCAALFVSRLLPDGDRYAWGFFSGYPGGGYHFGSEGEVLDRQFHFVDEDSTWSGTPGYLNRQRSTFLNRITLTEDLLLVATSDGQMECLERKTGASRWIYVYPARWREISYCDEWRPFWAHAGEYLANLRIYEREKFHGEVSGTVVVGGPDPGRFRVMLDPEPTGHCESPRAAMLLILFVLAIVPAGAAGLVVPLVKEGKSCLVIAVLVGGFVCSFFVGGLMGIFSPYAALGFEIFTFSLFCLVIYSGLSCEDGGKWPPRRRLIGLLIILFLPFAFWTVYCSVDTVTRWFS